MNPRNLVNPNKLAAPRNLAELKALARKPADALLGPSLGSISHLETPAAQVVLTFDDGPYPPVTQQLAGVLADHGAHATFFVLITRTRRNPGLVRELASAGHEIALHGLDHRRLTTLPKAEAAEWLRRSAGELADELGQPVRWFRPPHGAQSVTNRRQAAAAGLDVVLWSGTTWDWKDVPHETKLAKALEAARQGAILLAHDGAADASDLAVDPAAPGVDKPRLLDDLLGGLTHRGLEAVSLAEGLERGRAVRRVSFSR